MNAPTFKGALRRHGGQALVETVVALLVLAPLLVGVYVMWAWQDGQHAARVAARYVAFDFALAERGGGATGAGDALREHVLDDRTRGWFGLGRQAGALVEEGTFRLTLEPGVGHAALERIESTAFAMLAPAAALGRGPLDLQRGGAAVAEARLRFMPIEFPGGAGVVEGPELGARLALIADPWRAESVEVTRRRVGALAVGGRMQEWVEPLRAVRAAVSLLEPSFDRFCPGRIDVEVVPADRTAGPLSSLTDLRRRPC